MFSINFFKHKKSVFILPVVIFVFLEILVIIGIISAKDIQTKNYLSNLSPDFKSHIDVANTHLNDIAKIFYDTDINTVPIKKLMYDATLTKDKKRLQSLRDALYNELKYTYLYMKKHNVRQLHFHLPDSVSFLRFHRPNKFGDSLIGIRKTVDYVNEYRTPISAFEEGRIFNGFRNVFPIFYKDIFVGTVEVSFSFEGLQDILVGIDTTSYLFMVKTDVVDSKVFKNEQKNYKYSNFNGYEYDKDTLKNIMEFSLKDMYHINSIIYDGIKDKLDNSELFSIYYKSKDIYDNNSIIVSFSPVKNLNNKTVAYIIHYQFGSFIDMILNNINILFILLSTLSLLISAIFGWIFYAERKKQENIHYFAMHDALTNIYNRHGVYEILNHKLLEFKRVRSDFSVIFFDIDHFKNINDTYGHDIGDYVLENISKLVSSSIRESDIFARWGGEEFIIFLPFTNLKDAKKLAEKLRYKIQEHAFGNVEQITCSFGVTEFREKDTKTSLLKRVDELLYEAKDSGRNIVVDDFKS